MDIDLNAYYPASNLPRLYRERGRPGDERHAEEAEVATVLACRAAIANGTTDEWVRPTLLGLAFERGDVPEAIRLQTEIEADGPQLWKLSTTIDDLRASVAAQPDEDDQGRAAGRARRARGARRRRRADRLVRMALASRPHERTNPPVPARATRGIYSRPARVLIEDARIRNPCWRSAWRA